MATASPADRRRPNALENERGDLRLFSCDPREGVWRLLDAVVEDWSSQFRTSVHRYCWLDDGTLLHVHGNRPRLLDCASGATRAFGRGLRRHVQDSTVTGATEVLHRLAEMPSDQTFELYGDVAVVDGDVWMSATLTARPGPDRRRFACGCLSISWRLTVT